MKLHARTITSWNDLTLPDVLHVLQLLSARLPGMLFAGEELPEFLRLEIGRHLLGIDTATEQAWLEDCLVNGPGENDAENKLIFLDELRQVCHAATAFLYQPPPDQAPAEDDDDVDQAEAPPPQLALTLTRNPYSVIEYQDDRGRRHSLYGPTDELENVTLYELGAAFAYHENYLKSQASADLDRLIALLYRPSKPRSAHNQRSAYEGDRRLPYRKHEATLPARAQLVAHLPDLVKIALLFWFSSCRQAIVDGYQNIFRQDDPDVERIGNDYGFAGVLLSLAGGIVHLDAVADQPWSNGFTYLSYLEDQRKQAEMDAMQRRAQAAH